MDALSDVLSLLRVDSALSSRFEGEGEWAFRFPEYQHVKFGGVLEGQFFLWIDGSSDVLRLEQGDFYMLTDGRPFCSASKLDRPTVDGPATYRAIRGEDGVVRHRGPGNAKKVTLASGRFTFENQVTDVLLRHLPPLIHLRAQDHGTQALMHVLQLLKSETASAQAGAEVVRASLATLALVHVLRAYLASTARPRGWLGALADSRVGTALSLMHAKPAERWTIESLASAVGMSRTAFAQRFNRHVGQAPMTYLANWRMRVAQSALQHSDSSLTEIASRVGYLSDTAFNIAFKRATGLSPGRYRSMQSPSMTCADTR